MNQDYAQSHFPPMPVLDIWLAAPEESHWPGPFTALVDSGADFTIAPLALILPLRPPLVRQATLYSHWRDARETAIYTLDLRLGAVVQPAVMVAGDPHSQEVLLGRNFLNRLDLRLHGPRLRTYVRG
jgi:hypothetical protein